MHKLEVLHLFPVLDERLIGLLRSLTAEEWNAQTVAKLWKVKDVASHLLDGNLRNLSMSRDGYFGEKPAQTDSFQGIVDFINKLNMSWTSVTKRLSPQVLTGLLESSGKEYIAHLQSLDPDANAVFSVAWAGQDTSPNWFHIAREYTEKFLHQQQIRDAVGKPGIMTQELYYPFLDTLMYAFPQAFRDYPAETGTIVSLIIPTEIGGQWNILQTGSGWELNKDIIPEAHAQVTIGPDIAWKLFSRSWAADQVLDKVEIRGDRRLGEQVLQILGFMA